MPDRTEDHSFAEREKVLADLFYAHEALDRAHLASTFFDEHVHEHPYVQAHDTLRPAADKVMEALAVFYQLVGNHQPDDA